MSTAIHLATSENLDVLLALVERLHGEMDIASDDGMRRAGITPLLAGSPHGAAYLFGPARAPVGYAVITFGWSLEFGGMESFVDEIYIRPSVRKRGIGTETLIAIGRALQGAGVAAMHLEVKREDAPTQRLYEKAGFALRDQYCLMTRRL